MRLLSVLLAASPAALAFQFPFKVPFLQSDLVQEDVSGATPRIAIIGAGAGGSSAAFWISKAKQRFGVNVEVDIYESASYIGGRSTTVYPYDDKNYEPLELGASIFVTSNHNLWRATDEFNLTRIAFDKEDSSLGVWDGEKLLFSSGGGWWDMFKLIWRYGLTSPRRTDSIVGDMLKQFLTLYTPESPRWDNITYLASSLGWTEFLNSTASDYFLSHGVTQNYISEVIEAASRVNYGQNADAIHALEGAVSMATGGAAGVVGGNFQIFEKFVEASNATIFLNTTVTSITSKASSSKPWTVQSNQGSKNYKAVILAAPFHSTGISLSPALASQIPEQPYVNLHVTLLTTKSPSIDAAYLGLPPTEKLPSMILTTYDNARKGGKEPEFNSLSYHGKVSDDEWGVKIFSKEKISDEWLQTVFKGEVGWVYRKVWEAYPVLPPTTDFPPVKLDTGFYYVNAFEPFISTMETETIASRNVVELLLNEEFSSTLCAPQISEDRDRQLSLGEYYFPSRHPDGFVLGWDC